MFCAAGMDTKVGKVQRSERQLPSVSSETFYEPRSVHRREVTEEEKALATSENKKSLREFGGEINLRAIP